MDKSRGNHNKSCYCPKRSIEHHPVVLDGGDLFKDVVNLVADTGLQDLFGLGFILGKVFLRKGFHDLIHDDEISAKVTREGAIQHTCLHPADLSRDLLLIAQLCPAVSGKGKDGCIYFAMKGVGQSVKVFGFLLFLLHPLHQQLNLFSILDGLFDTGFHRFKGLFPFRSRPLQHGNHIFTGQFENR